MEPNVNDKKKRGWDALEEKLRERGLTEIKIEEARESFYNGIEILASLFLSDYLPEKHR